MKINIREADDIAIDWLIANLENKIWNKYSSATRPSEDFLARNFMEHERKDHRYSSDWAMGGPLIAEHKVLYDESVKSSTLGQGFIACMMLPREDNKFMHIQKHSAFGKTHLIAGMRSILLKTYGDEAEVPDELYDECYKY